jgi:transposase
MVKSAVNSIVSDTSRSVDGTVFEATPDVLKNIIMQQATTINQQSETIKVQKQNIARLDHLVKLLQKAVFGQKSERIIETEEEAQGVFADLLKEYYELNPDSEEEPEEDAEDKPSGKQKKRKPRRSFEELVDEDLPRERIVIDLPEDQKVDKYGNPLVKIGEDTVSKLAFKPSYLFWKDYIYPKYAAKKDALAGVKRAPALDFAIPGGRFDESFYANLIYSKCSMHLPFYRLEEDFKANNSELSRQMMSSSFIKAAKVLQPIVNLMKKDLLQRNIAFSDDTSARMLAPGKGKTDKIHIWVYVAGGQGPPYRIFEFAPTRSGKNPKKFFENFNGYVHCDAFSGYDILFLDGNIIECGCWMHVRRKFFEAQDAPKELRNSVLRMIRNIYRYEAAMKKLDRETQGALILKIRNDKIRPIIDKLFSVTAQALVDGVVMPKSNFEKAIHYMHNLGQALKNFMENPYLQPDNGESERALRPMTIGRKNWLFFGSEEGGKAMGTLMSIVQTCRRMKINVREYLEDVLRRINGHSQSKLHELLPGNWTKAESYYN